MTNIIILVGLIIVFPTLVLGGLIKPSFGLATLLFTLPLLSQGYRFFVGSQMLFPSLETIAVLVLWISVQLHNLRHRSPLQKDWGVVLAAFIFLLAGLLSAFFAHDSEIAFKILLAGGVSPLLCFLLLDAI